MTAVLIAMLVAASGPLEIKLDPAAKPTVSFTLHHPLHNVRGVTHALEGKAREYSDGTLEVEIRAALSSFRTGRPAIDEDFLELMDTGRYPDVTVRAIVPPQGERRPGTTIDADTTVKIDVRGRTRTFPAAARIARGGGGHLTATGHFVVELHDLGIETPRYMFIDASPTIQVDFDLAWLEEQVASERLLMGFESAGGAGSSSGAGSTSGGQDAGAAAGGPTAVSGSSGGTTGGAPSGGSATSGGGSTSDGEASGSSGSGATSGGESSGSSGGSPSGAGSTGGGSPGDALPAGGSEP